MRSYLEWLLVCHRETDIEPAYVSDQLEEIQGWGKLWPSRFLKMTVKKEHSDKEMKTKSQESRRLTLAKKDWLLFVSPLAAPHVPFLE